MTKRTIILLALTIPLLTGCGAGSGGGAGTAPRPTAGPALLEPPHVELPDGATIKLELALTPEERERGLMFRTTLKPDHGMLFVFEQPARWPFWMKDTWIALDLVFLDARGTITEVFTDVPPCRAEPCPQYVPEGDARAVLEVAAGTAAAHGLVPGVRLKFSRVPDYPVE